MRHLVALLFVGLLLAPLTGTLVQSNDRSDWIAVDEQGLHWRPVNAALEAPEQAVGVWVTDDTPWWERTTLDLNRNRIHDHLEVASGTIGVGVSYTVPVTEHHLLALDALGVPHTHVIDAVDAVLLGFIDAAMAPAIAQLDDVAMVEQYGGVVLYGDVQTPAVKAVNSSVYPVGAWDLGVTGEGINIAMVDTGVDNEHPGLNEKFIAGFDAVCYVHSDPVCVAGGARETDGTYDPDDGHQHGTACMGMAAATGMDASGSQTEFYGSAPDADLIDVRIGTDLGAGPFENYIIEQEFYESAMNGLQWIIDNKDTEWQGAGEDNFGIDIISLSWGITSHEGGGSDGEDMHSRILNEAMEAGLVVSVAAGNDGPDNDGLSGMGSSSLSITVGATDDINTVDRSDDTVASYSSRGPRRDNGDSNPLNELKPEVSAPGTNIIQAEGCVTSGGCNNLLGGDAANNGYTGRGSGTSYATPAVSGILALMIEANPALSPAEMKEILKLTAERRGEPSAPEVDPFWNRDFGWGMVDALAAVEMAFFLKEEGLTGQIDVSSQVHIISAALNESTGLFEVRGLAWGQNEAIASVEARIDGGAWFETAYASSEGQLAALERFEWTLALDPAQMASGNHTIEVRGLNAQGSPSLSVFTVVMGTGADLDGASGAGLSFGLAGLVVAFVVLMFLFGRIDPPQRLEVAPEAMEGDARSAVLEAELLPSDTESSAAPVSGDGESSANQPADG